MQSDPDVVSLIAPFVIDLYLHPLLVIVKRARYCGDLVAFKRNGGHSEDGVRRSSCAVHRERHVGGVARNRSKEKEGERYARCASIF